MRRNNAFLSKDDDYVLLPTHNTSREQYFVPSKRRRRRCHLTTDIRLPTFSAKPKILMSTTEIVTSSGEEKVPRNYIILSPKQSSQVRKYDTAVLSPPAVRFVNCARVTRPIQIQHITHQWFYNGLKTTLANVTGKKHHQSNQRHDYELFHPFC